MNRGVDDVDAAPAGAAEPTATTPAVPMASPVTEQPAVVDQPAATRTAGAPPTGSTPLRPRRRSHRLAFWVPLVLLGLITGCWSLASPLTAGLDEPAHMTKAAAVVRGQLVGAPYVDPNATEQERAQQGGRAVVDVPALYQQLPDLPACFAFERDKTASCQPGLVADPDAPSQAVTSASRYNPLYYAIVGLPTLLPGSAKVLYLTRFVSAFLAVLLLAFAWRTVAELPRARWPTAATVVAVTPMVVFLSSTVNPQSVEIAGALLVWVALLALVRDPEPDLLRRRCARLLVGTVLFVNARGLGPLFLLVILVAVVVSSPWRNTVAALRDRRSWPFVAGCAVAVGAALAWSAVVGTLDTPAQVMLPEYADASTILELTVNKTSEYLQQMLGLFGWIDTPLPGWTYLLAAGVLLFVVFAGLALAGWRDRLVLAGLLVIVIGLPIATQFAQSRYIGIFWQGRYLLPVFIGIPLIAGFAVDRRGALPDWVSARLLGAAVAGTVVVQVVAFAVNLHRYVNGWSGSWFHTDAASWRPPLPALVLVVLVTVAWVLLALAARRLTRPESGLDDARPTGPSVEVAA